jgi:lambda family phage portal protein
MKSRATFLDRFVGLFSPKAQLSRMAHREGIRILKAAGEDRNTKSWKKNSGPPEELYRTGGRSSRQRALHLSENHDAIGGALTTITDHIVASGIRTDSEIQYNPNADTTDATAMAARDRLNQEVEDSKRRWEERAYVTGASRLDPVEADTLLLRTLMVQGETIVHNRYLEDSSREIPLAYEIIDPSQLENGFGALPQGNNIVEQGVEYSNETNAIVAYHITDNGYNPRTHRVPASDIQHTFRTDRPGQQRGITWLAPVIPRAYELDDIIEYAIIARKVQSAIALVVADNPNDMGLGGPMPGTATADGVYTDSNGNKLRGINPGMIHHVGTGQVTSHTPAPPQDLDVLTGMLMRGIAIGLGVSYEWLSGDYRQANFASLRLSENKTWKRMYTLHGFYTRKVKQPQHRQFIDLAQAYRRIPAVPRRADAYAHAFSQPQRDWGANPLQEVNAISTALGTGLTSIQEEAAKRGVDWRQLLKRIVESRQFATMLDPNLELYADLFPTITTAPPSE